MAWLLFNEVTLALEFSVQQLRERLFSLLQMGQLTCYSERKPFPSSHGCFLAHCLLPCYRLISAREPSIIREEKGEGQVSMMGGTQSLGLFFSLPRYPSTYMNKMYYAPHNAKMNRVSGHGDAIAQRDVPCVIIGLSSRLSPFSFMGPASEMVICLPLFAIASAYSFFPLSSKQQLLTIVILFYVATQILLVLYTLFWVASTTFCLENGLAFVKE